MRPNFTIDKLSLLTLCERPIRPGRARRGFIAPTILLILLLSSCLSDALHNQLSLQHLLIPPVASTAPQQLHILQTSQHTSEAHLTIRCRAHSESDSSQPVPAVSTSFTTRTIGSRLKPESHFSTLRTKLRPCMTKAALSVPPILEIPYSLHSIDRQAWSIISTWLPTFQPLPPRNLSPTHSLLPYPPHCRHRHRQRNKA